MANSITEIGSSPPAEGLAPWSVAAVFWRHRRLILRLAKRDIQARYRGTLLGLAWTILMPLLMLGVYTLIFGVIFGVKWGLPQEGSSQYALMVFCGLIPFNLVAECVSRAPTLILENVSYVTRVVFPLEIMPLVALVSGLFNAAVSVLIMLVFGLFIVGPPPLTALFLPLVLLPLVLGILGLSWFLAALGVYLRDIRHFIGLLITALMFLSAVFYPLKSVPEAIRGYISLNPLLVVIENSRNILFWGQAPDLVQLGGYVLAGWLTAWLGFLWFMKTKDGFADVL